MKTFKLLCKKDWGSLHHMNTNEAYTYVLQYV